MEMPIPGTCEMQIPGNNESNMKALYVLTVIIIKMWLPEYLY